MSEINVEQLLQWSQDILESLQPIKTMLEQKEKLSGIQTQAQLPDLQEQTPIERLSPPAMRLAETISEMTRSTTPPQNYDFSDEELN